MSARLLGLAVLLLFGASRAQAAEHGVASFYGWHEHGRTMANGHRFEALGATAAHPTLPLGTRVVITNLHNHRTARATITDRGPFAGHRSIDVSLGVARRLGMERAGLAPVSIEPRLCAVSPARSKWRRLSWTRRKRPNTFSN